MKLALLIVSACLLAYGVITRHETLAFLGAAVYILALSIDLLTLIRLSIKYRKGNEPDQEVKTIAKTITPIAEGIILIFGLISMFFEDSRVASISGGIIWYGTIGIYILSGIIIGSLTNLPIKMGYGGWYFSRYKKKRKR